MKNDLPVAGKSLLGFFSLFSVAVGLIIAQSGMVPMLQTAAITGSGYVLALGCAYLLGLTCVLSFSELALMFPRSGGLATYTEAAIGNYPAIIATFSAYVIPPMLGIAAEIFLLDTVLSQLFPGFAPPLVIGYATLFTFAVLNYLGIDAFARIQNTIVVVMLLAITFLAASAFSTAGAAGVPAANDLGSFNPMGMGVFSMVALAIWCMVGAEFTCPLVEQARNPKRDIPWAMLIGLTTIFILYLLLGYGALMLVPAEQLASSATPHLLFASAVFGDGGKALLAAIAVTATASTVNSVMAAVPHMLLGMARNRQVFPQFSKLSRHGSPWVGIVFMVLLISVPLALMTTNVDTIMVLLISASVSWFLAYIIAHVDVIVLRTRHPELRRPFVSPFYPWPQVLGIAGFTYIAMNCSPSPEMTGQVYGVAGGLLLVVAVIGALWVRLYMKEPLFRSSLSKSIPYAVTPASAE
ncbi:APC family permease [Pseudomonas sp. S 311-6]|nr:APC family permease [Pseudomonas sp. S 311-6]